MLYKTSVVLNLFEINTLLKLLEEKINKDDTQKDMLKLMYVKLEDCMSNIKFLKKDDVTKILTNQKIQYIKNSNERKEVKNE